MLWLLNSSVNTTEFSAFLSMLLIFNPKYTHKKNQTQQHKTQTFRGVFCLERRQQQQGCRALFLAIKARCTDIQTVSEGGTFTMCL